MNESPITAARCLIASALKRAIWEMRDETALLEIEITPDTTLYLDIRAEEMDGYNEIEIIAADVCRDKEKRAYSLTNIAEAIGERLDRAVKERKREARG